MSTVGAPVRAIVSRCSTAVTTVARGGILSDASSPRTTLASFSPLPPLALFPRAAPESCRRHELHRRCGHRPPRRLKSYRGDVPASTTSPPRSRLSRTSPTRPDRPSSLSIATGAPSSIRRPCAAKPLVELFLCSRMSSYTFPLSPRALLLPLVSSSCSRAPLGLCDRRPIPCR